MNAIRKAGWFFSLALMMACVMGVLGSIRGEAGAGLRRRPRAGGKGGAGRLPRTGDGRAAGGDSPPRHKLVTGRAPRAPAPRLL